jgi:glycosyltransferase involved in cell wall biosynthesis
MKNKLSVVLATRNEEENIAKCLAAITGIADEIIVFDEKSSDKTVAIAKKYGAKVYIVPHNANFHITKQKAIDKAGGDWILQLDADEVVTAALAKEIKEIIVMPQEDIGKRVPDNKKKALLFARHEMVIRNRDGELGSPTGEVVAFFVPRKNIFLGKPLIHAGVYPDPAIRLIKKGKAYLPAKSVHEIMKIDGKVGWLFNDMLHYDSPTFSRYLSRLNRYTDLHAAELAEKKVTLSIWTLFYFSFIKPILVFINLYVRHLGVLDGMPGFIWSAFSSLHFPIAYFKYWQEEKS